MVEYLVLSAITVHLLHFTYAGLVMERNTNNYGDSHNSTAEEFLSSL